MKVCLIIDGQELPLMNQNEPSLKDTDLAKFD